MGSTDTELTGRAGEQRALQYLRQHGLFLLFRNFRCRGGEIDIVMLDSQQLVFVEVRSRGRRSFAPAAQTVDARKQRKLIRTAAMFVARHSRHAQRTMRFDVIGIDGPTETDITWLRDAFRLDRSSC